MMWKATADNPAIIDNTLEVSFKTIALGNLDLPC